MDASFFHHDSTRRVVECSRSGSRGIISISTNPTCLLDIDGLRKTPETSIGIRDQRRQKALIELVKKDEGMPRKPSQKTETHSTWTGSRFVFFLNP
jgi:hypothetical protein